MKYDTLVCDIDGTLLIENQFSQGTIAALDVLRKRGIAVTLATGRNQWEAQYIVDQLAIKLPVILCNGSQLFCFSKNRLLWAEPLLIEEVRSSVATLPKETQIHCFTGYGWKTWTAEELSHHSGDIYRLVSSISFQTYSKLKDDETFPFWVYWNGCECEFSLKTAEKGRGLAQFCALLGRDPNRVVAIGNGSNDISLLRTAGVGLAVDDAEKSLLDIADGIVPAAKENPLGKVAQWMLGDLPWERIVI